MNISVSNSVNSSQVSVGIRDKLGNALDKVEIRAISSPTLISKVFCNKLITIHMLLEKVKPKIQVLDIQEIGKLLTINKWTSTSQNQAGSRKYKVLRPPNWSQKWSKEPVSPRNFVTVKVKILNQIYIRTLSMFSQTMVTMFNWLMDAPYMMKYQRITVPTRFLNKLMECTSSLGTFKIFP